MQKEAKKSLSRRPLKGCWLALIRIGLAFALGHNGTDILGLLHGQCCIALLCQEQQKKSVTVHSHLVGHLAISTEPGKGLLANACVDSFDAAVQLPNIA